MARASTVWVVMDPIYAGRPFAAFTVKHELLTWAENLGVLDGYPLYAMSDGGRRAVRFYSNIRELL